MSHGMIVTTAGKRGPKATSMLLGLMLAFSPAAPSLAQNATSGDPEAEADVLVQKEAVDALDKMAAHLRTLKEFQLTATIRVEDVLEDDEKIEIAGETNYYVRRPNRLKMRLETDKNTREYYYDGKTVTHVSPALGYYSVFEAPDTIAKTIIAAKKKYGVRFPLADLFFWNSNNEGAAVIKSAYFAGQTKILGDRCNHYAYRIDGFDIQVWIRASGDPLPCRMVVTNTDEVARPQYAATLEWDTDAEFDDSIFLFAPPPEMGRIDQDEVATSTK
jgi:hypothetical protein